MIRIGIDLGGTKTEVIALDDRRNELLRRREPTPAGDYGATLALIARLVRETESAIGKRGSVGVGTPGALSPATRRLRNSNSTCLNGQPLKEDLERAIGREIRMENDANCFALSEAIDGAARKCSSVFGVILGTGVGGGIVIDGRVVTGANAIAGEWGHNPLPWPRSDELPGPAVLLRPARLHRDVSFRAGPRRRLRCGNGTRTLCRGDARSGVAGRPFGCHAIARAL